MGTTTVLTMPAVPISHLDLPRRIRLRAKQTQSAFWAQFGVTQSSGSRYESTAQIPLPVAILIELRASGVICDEELLDARDRCVKSPWVRAG